MKQVTPALKTLDVRSAYTYRIYALLNLAVGVTFITGLSYLQKSTFLLTTDLISYTVWGIIFSLVGLSMLAAYYTKMWRIMRTVMVVDLFIRLLWCLSFLVRQIEFPTFNVLFVLFFFAVTGFEIVSYLAFPNYKEGKNDGSD